MKQTYRSGSIPIPVTIHLFAAAHAAVAVLSRVFNYVDDVPLTILTLSMIVVISVRERMRVEFMAALALVCSFLGFLFGIYGAELIQQVVRGPVLAPAITTGIITELIGWGTYAATRIPGTDRQEGARIAPSAHQTIGIAAAILLLRIAYTVIFRSAYFEQAGIYAEFQRLLDDTLALMTMLCCNIIFVNLRRRIFPRSRVRVAATALFVILLTMLTTAIVVVASPYRIPTDHTALWFARLYAVVLLADIIVYALLQLIVYVIDAHIELRAERDKKHRIAYQYDRLKLQINPHFLFNSLNILDFLVQEGERERASAFIRKLADTYRYMLKNEFEPLVPLGEELRFARKYIDLLQERFTSGFTVEIDIPDDRMARHVVPCCLQLLIENATKHNIVGPDKPLRIRIAATDDRLVVTNNLQPRISAHESTRMGLETIRQQYLDLSGKEIVVTRTETEFRVELPLL